MAHFAEINDSNVVTRVIVVGNKDTADAQGNEKEYIGAAFCERLFGGTNAPDGFPSGFKSACHSYPIPAYLILKFEL